MRIKNQKGTEIEMSVEELRHFKVDTHADLGALMTAVDTDFKTLIGFEPHPIMIVESKTESKNKIRKIKTNPFHK